MNDLKIGDLVTRTTYSRVLEKGKTYRVSFVSSNGRYIKLEGEKGTWNGGYFAKAEPQPFTRLEVGKFYLLRNGMTVGPMRLTTAADDVPMRPYAFMAPAVSPSGEDDDWVPAWTPDGRYSTIGAHVEWDIVSEAHVAPQPLAVQLTGTKADVMAAFFQLPKNLQQAYLSGLLDGMAASA